MMALTARRASWVFVGVCLATLVACGGDDGDDGGDPKPNEPPTLVGPTSLPMKQGRSAQATLDVSDPNGDAVTVTLTPPAGIEASIDNLALDAFADHSVSGSQPIAVSLADALGATAEATITADVAPLKWGDRVEWTTGGPEAREHAALIVDEAGKRIVMIGGSGYAPYLTPLGDVWQFDLTTKTWTALTPTGDLPTAGGSRRVAQVPGQPTAYLFGGYGANQAVNDELYRVDVSGGGVAFQKLDQVSPPPARALHGFAYDPESDRFFVFAGFGAGLFADLWSMTLEGNTATWTNVNPATAPSGRYGFFYGVDQTAGRVLLFSGAQSGGQALNPARDTWALDMRTDPPTWSLLLDGEGAGVPPGRRNGCFVMDPLSPRLFVFGGTADAMTTEAGLFVLDARPGKEKWTRLDLAMEPPLRSSGVAVYDPGNDALWMGFGNTTGAVYRDLAPLGY